MIFNSVIAAGQWSSSFFIASAFLMWLTGVKIDKDIANGFLIALCLSAPLFLTVGMYQCWRLPDRRRWFALPGIAVLLASGALMFAGVVENDRESKAQAITATVHESAAWMTAKADYDAAMASYNELASRKFPANYPKWFNDNEEKKKAQWVVVQEKSVALTKLEPKIETEAHTSFDLFGKDWAWVVASAFVVLYELANHMIAMALAFNSEPTAPKTERATQSRAKEVHTPEEYVELAEKLGKNGALAGYRDVAEATKQTTYLCRGLLGLAADQGLIEKIPGGRGVRRRVA